MGALLGSRPNLAARDNLAKVLTAERPLAMVGAGLSVAAGMPTWKTLLDEMEDQLPPLHDDYKRALHDERDLLWRAEEYRRLIGDNNYQLFLRLRFGSKRELSPTAPVVTFVKLPFRHFLTTNYDDVLLDAHQIAGLAQPRVLNWSREDDVRAFIFSLRTEDKVRFLLHVHGRHVEPQSIVFTDNDYTDRYVRSSDTARKLFAIFTTERIVFTGFSLDDPDLMALLREVNATLRADEARHFAIMGLERPVSEILERNRLRKRYGVEPVFYDNADGSHAGLVEVLQWLSHQAGPSKRKAATEGRVAVTGLAALGASVTPDAEVDPEDPQKGKWGGMSRVNGRELSARVREIEPDWFQATIKVRSIDKKRPLKGDVVFHLHPTVVPSVRTAKANNNAAQIKVESYGSYTVGAEADGGKTRLELDLSTLENAPMMFQLN